MRFTSLRMRGIGPFTDEVFVDLEQVPGPLVAVTGSNGAGKSMSLEALFGAVYRKMPTRGSLRDVATSRDSFVEVGVVNGQPWTLRQRVDAHSGKGESEVLDAGGAAVLSAAKLREGDAWVASHLPSPTVVLSSMFGAQGSQGFLDLDPAERKRVVLQMLGHDRLEALSKAAGERAREAKATLDTLVARIADEEKRGGDAGAQRAELTHLKRALELAEGRAKVAEAAVAKAHEDAVEHERQAAARREADRRLGELCLRRAELGRKLDELDERRGNNRDLLDRAEEIRRAASRREELAGTCQELEKASQEAEKAHREATQKHSRFVAEQRDAAATAERLENDLRSLEAKAAEVSSYQTQLIHLEDAQDSHTTARRALEAAGHALQELEELRLAGKDRRLSGMRTGLELIAVTPAHAKEVASATLDEDERLEADLAEAPARIAKAQAEVKRCEKAVRVASERVAARDRVGAHLHALGDVEGRLRATARALSEAKRAEIRAKESASAPYEEAEVAWRRYSSTKRELDGQRLERIELQDAASLLPRLEAAEARLEELDAQRATLVAERERNAAGVQAAELSLPKVMVAKPDLQAAKDEAEEARRSLAGLQSGAQAAERELARLEASVARLGELAAERVLVEEELADYRLLEQDLGRNGVQALELDAAGPELTELANDLLRSCLGTRFSVRIDASRKSADGKKDIEGCWVTVYDAEANREAEAKTFSGGERVLVGEAVNLALTMMGVRHAGFTRPTIVRDETGAALDVDKGHAYVAMLRRAAELVDADRVLFVTHQPELHELADARIHAENGTLTVVS